MSTEDQDITSFFKDMRTGDMAKPIPEFETFVPKKRPSKLRYMLPVGIAASLIVAFVIWNTLPENNHSENELVISIEEAETTTETLLQNDTSVFSWESSTASLINDFND